jgi:hypothetical protein
VATAPAVLYEALQPPHCACHEAARLVKVDGLQGADSDSRSQQAG